jgi:hypothetical protein
MEKRPNCARDLSPTRQQASAPVKIRRGCLHTTIHVEGSLGWFCNTCGAPIYNPEDYYDG